ncbi:hypothetical protein C8Q74DRAFT_1364224 [Fomes fomentarius]|nr:hypothetical protein C8Q74DRAFT_1364224 [Fomes fomentarius]
MAARRSLASLLDMISSPSTSSAAVDSGYFDSLAVSRRSSDTGSTGRFADSSSHARTLVLCFDGTGEKFDEDCSNVVQFFRLLRKDNHDEQIVYYQPGIGTYTSGTRSPGSLISRVDQLLDQMFAWNLGSHVMGGYEFLMQNYKEGDKICLFGFSRGAYTARALAGMLHKVGLLPVCNHQQIPFAWSTYRLTKVQDPDWKKSSLFKDTFSTNVKIDFIGVWDTVTSVGLIPLRSLPFTKHNRAIKCFRHALALDERRVRFRPAFHRHTVHNRGTVPDETNRHDTLCAMRHEPLSESHFASEAGSHRGILKHEMKDTSVPSVLQVWFAGGHCDVGGGSVPNETLHSLSRIPLRWMIRECFRANTGIRFRPESLRNVGLDLATLHPHVLTRPPALKAKDIGTTYTNAKDLPHCTEEDHEVRDAIAGIVDKLVTKPIWWLLEWLPAVTKKDGWWCSPNNGNGRKLPEDGPFHVHRSVKIRQEAGLKYEMKVQHNDAKIVWVD